MNAVSCRLSQSYAGKNRLMQQATAFKLVRVEKWVTFLLLGFILIIATFNVIISLSLLIIEKTESINVFKNLGATNKQITQIFVLEGWLISLTGAVSGIVCGLTLCLVQQYFGLLKLSGDATYMITNSYPVKVDVLDVLIVFSLVAIIGLITSATTSFIVSGRLRK